MALPKDNPNAATDAVAAEIKKMGPKDLAALPDLDGRDLQLIGTLIQYFMDLNLRRALETFHAEKMLPKEYAKLWPDSLPDSSSPRRSALSSKAWTRLRRKSRSCSSGFK